MSSPRTIHVETELDAPAERVWQAMQNTTSFLYVCRGLLGIPALAGRIDPIRAGETDTGRLYLFHVVPAWRHTIHVAALDSESRAVHTREHGGILRQWNHTLAAQPLGAGRARYSDTVELDAGRFTPLAAAIATSFYRYRQRRWRRLARKHLATPACYGQ